MTRWIHRWLDNGWRNRHGDPVCHRQLWETLWAMAIERHVEWVPATKLPPPAPLRDGLLR
jgi:ribonuclease HI